MSKDYKIIIAGGRDFDNYPALYEHIEKCLKEDNLPSPDTEIVIVSGRAKGADRLGEKYAAEKGYKILKYPAQWYKYGVSAGIIRNKQMAEVADALIAFWDGESHGTANMIKTAKEKGLKVYPVWYYKRE